MKKIYKLLFLVFIFLGVATIGISVKAVEENIPEVIEEVPNIEEDNTDIIDEMPTEPSEFAIWVEEHIIEIIIGVLTGTSSLGVVIWQIVRFLKKRLLEQEKGNKEISTENRKLREVNVDLTKQLTEVLKELKENQKNINTIIKAFTDFMELTFKKLALIGVSQEDIKEMLRLAFSNNKELVKLGVAEEISKIAIKEI